MKKYLSIALISAMAFTTNLSAEDKEDYHIAGTAALTSNYIWRGISYTDGTATGQVGFNFNDIAHIDGFHINFWDSGIQEGSEIDAIIGYEMAINDNLSLDIGAINYYYTQDYINITFAGASYAEAFAVASFEDYSLSYYREIGYGDSVDYKGNTFIAGASFGRFDLCIGTRNSFQTIPDDTYFGSAAINWESYLLPGLDANLMIAYNSGLNFDGSTNDLFGIEGTEGATTSLTFTKSF